MAFLLSYIVLWAELAFNQAVPLFLGKVVDAAVYKSYMILFLNSSLLYTLVFLGQQGCGFLQLQLWQILNNKYVYSLRVLCYERILRLKAKKLCDIETEDMLQIINGDTMDFHHIVQRYAMRIVNAGIGMVVSLVIVAYMKWEIALIIAVLIPASILITENIKKKMKKASEKLHDKHGQYESWLMEIFNGFREIKLFSAENQIYDSFIGRNLQIIKSVVKQAKLQFISNNLIHSIYFIASLIFYVVSVLFVVNQSINVAQYIVIAAYYGVISGNFQDILKDNMAFQSRKTSVERVFSLLDEDFEDDLTLNNIHITNGLINIKNLSFSYQKDMPVLKNITLSILPGERISVVGEPGVGKSTLAYLPIKYFLPNDGEIFIDNQDIKKCTYSSIRKNIEIVSQDVIVFNATIKENVCSDKNVTDDTIWKVLGKVQLRSEIEALGNGIYTTLGKDGGELSGGQNQRLAIARMLYKNPKIIILDEATSLLDAVTEREILNNLNNIFKDKTLIVVSHKPALQIDFDERILIKDKRIFGV